MLSLSYYALGLSAILASSEVLSCDDIQIEYETLPNQNV